MYHPLWCTIGKTIEVELEKFNSTSKQKNWYVSFCIIIQLVKPMLTMVFQKFDEKLLSKTLFMWLAFNARFLRMASSLKIQLYRQLRIVWLGKKPQLQFSFAKRFLASGLSLVHIPWVFRKLRRGHRACFGNRKALCRVEEGTF